MIDHNAEMRCPECDNPLPAYEFGRPNRFCSPRCTRRGHRRTWRKKARARDKGATVLENVDPLRIFERDAWRCVDCLKPTPLSKRGSLDHDEPTIDHAISLGEGGEHTYANVRLLCRECNKRKGKRESSRAQRNRRASR